MVVLGNTGPVNQLLVATGLIDRPLRMMFTSGAVTLGLVHVLTPFLVLSVWASLARLDPAIERAAVVARRVSPHRVLPGRVAQRGAGRAVGLADRVLHGGQQLRDSSDAGRRAHPNGVRRHLHGVPVDAGLAAGRGAGGRAAGDQPAADPVLQQIHGATASWRGSADAQRRRGIAVQRRVRGVYHDADPDRDAGIGHRDVLSRPAVARRFPALVRATAAQPRLHRVDLGQFYAWRWWPRAPRC